MKQRRVRELIIPLSEYATVSEDATLLDAVMALEEAQTKWLGERYAHRAVLVYDKNKQIVGKLSQLDLIRGLESEYKQIGDLKYVTHTGFSPKFIKSMIENYSLWQKPLDNICRKAAKFKVKDIMYTPTEGEFVSEDATLDEAIHQLIIGRHQSLLVAHGKDIVGILRLTDVFEEVCRLIRTCEP